MCSSLASILFWDLPCYCLSFPFSCSVQSICCCGNVPQFVHSLICWRTFGLLPALTVINRRAMNIHVQMFLQTYVSSSLGHKPRSEMATPWCMNVLSILITKKPTKDCLKNVLMFYWLHMKSWVRMILISRTWFSFGKLGCESLVSWRTFI